MKYIYKRISILFMGIKKKVGSREGCYPVMA
jgi:hypothetical protein